MIKINTENCNGCGVCSRKCPFGAISLNEKHAVFGDNCVYCGLCRDICPQKAILIDVDSVSSNNNSEYKGIWVVMQLDTTGRVKKVSFELLSEARKLGDRLKEKVSALCLCKVKPADLENILGDLGCEELLLVEDGFLYAYDTDVFAGIISGLISQNRPSVVLFPATEDGRDLAPRISGRLKIGLTADCTALDIDKDGLLVQIRPTYGGNIMASIITPNHRPQMASIRPNVFKVENCQTKTKVSVHRFNFKIESNAVRVKRIGVKKKEAVYKDVGEANIIIAAGYGVGRENLKLVHELAIKTGAAVGVTRKVVDEGWEPFEIQIGQTGKSVAPELYIAFGISGALQHSIGIKNAKKIIAVNNDPVAPIFAIADTAILGDAGQILCELNMLADRKKHNTFKVLQERR
jgi:electron transfer flavoprotein alpha subunit